jgi:pyruvate/2-oxoglutarate/acetoin dehydrogenase E1 component
MSEMTISEALHAALHEEMLRDQEVFTLVKKWDVSGLMA